MAARCYHLFRLRERGVSDRPSQCWSQAVPGTLLLHNSQLERHSEQQYVCVVLDNCLHHQQGDIIRQEQLPHAVVCGQKHMGDPSKTPNTHCPV